MKVFSCDRCHKQFGGPLDTVEYGGKAYDLCAPCRKEIEDRKQTALDDFFGEVENG